MIMKNSSSHKVFSYGNQFISKHEYDPSPDINDADLMQQYFDGFRGYINTGQIELREWPEPLQGYFDEELGQNLSNLAVDEANIELSSDNETGGGFSRRSFQVVPVSLAEAARSSFRSRTSPANFKEDFLNLMTDLDSGLQVPEHQDVTRRRDRSSTRRSGENDGLHNDTAASRGEDITAKKVEAIVSQAVNDCIEFYTEDINSVKAEVKLFEQKLASAML